MADPRAAQRLADQEAVSTKMIAEDTAWAMDVVASARNATDQLEQGVVPLLYSHHAVRIIYEARRALVGRFGRTTLAVDVYPDVTERVRNATKLLNDKRITLSDAQSSLDAELRRHQGYFYSQLRWALLRPLQPDAGLFLWNGALVGSTITVARMLGIELGNPHSICGHPIRDVTYSWGQQLGAFHQETSTTSRVPFPVSFAGANITQTDEHLKRYLKTRFANELAIELKLILLWLQCEMNTVETLLPTTSSGHEFAVFRASVITTFHCIHGLYVVAQSNRLPAKQARTLDRLLAEPSVAAILAEKDVRNRCMHYAISNEKLHFDHSLPMDGIIEAVQPRLSFQAYRSSLLEATQVTADFLNNW